MAAEGSDLITDCEMTGKGPLLNIHTHTYIYILYIEREREREPSCGPNMISMRLGVERVLVLRVQS